MASFTAGMSPALLARSPGASDNSVAAELRGKTDGLRIAEETGQVEKLTAWRVRQEVVAAPHGSGPRDLRDPRFAAHLMREVGGNGRLRITNPMVWNGEIYPRIVPGFRRKP
jgi:hypothetical protein